MSTPWRLFVAALHFDVWFKTEGGWKIAHVHYSEVPKPTEH
jgi:hypothetical protein